MNILVVSNLYPPNVFGGAEVLTHGLVSFLRQKHAVTILTSSSRHRHEENTYPALRIWEPYPNSIRVTPLFILKVVYKSIFNYLQTRLLIRRLKPDLILISDLKRIGYGPLIAAQQTSPTVVFLHDAHSFDCMDLGKGFKKMLKRFYGRLIFYRPVCIDYAISNSQQTLRAQNPQVIVKQAQVVGVGINPPSDLAEILKTHPKGSKKGPVILFVGRIERVKGVHDIVEACHVLVRKHALQDLELQIVGFENDPQYRHELEHLIQLRGLEKQVHFVGRVTEREKYQRLHQADLFVFASNWDEGHGQTYLEAMICGTPCVCTLAGGAREVLKHGENCLTFEAGKPDGLATAIIEVLENHHQREKIVLNAQRMVLERFTQEQFAARCETLFMDCVSQWQGDLK